VVDGTAAIIGAGIGGLACALALRRQGWATTVFEREAGVSGAGTALGMWPSALTALDALGLGDRVRQLGQRQRSGEFRRPDGTRLGVIDVARLERRSGDPVYLLSRPALLGVLQDALDDGVVHFRSPVEDVAPLQDEFDLVVAADGVFSRVRQELFGDTYRARYTGSTAWRGWVENMPTDSFTETWGVGAKFGVTPQEGGRTNWYATTTAAEGSFSPGAELSRLRALFGTWSPPVRDVLDAIEEVDILRHDLFAVPLLPTFVTDRVSLIGDAAHGMPPDLGRGACEALIDAVTLATSVDRAATLPDGLRDYSALRRRRVQRLVGMTHAAARLSRMRRPLWLRDTMLRMSLLVPPPA